MTPIYSSDIWRPGIVRATILEIVSSPNPQTLPVVWFPEQRDFSYLADPFGVWRDGYLHVFAEIYDYRSKRGAIRRLTFDRKLALIDSAPALVPDYHVSYPFIIEHGGEIYMLPEAHQSGKLTLYRAHNFPDQWQPVCDLLAVPAIDPSVIFFDGLWWLFYALPGADRHAERALYVASAEKLTGPWHPHPMNPVRLDMTSSRPGGTPFVYDGRIVLPTQNCVYRYGESINLLRMTTLTPQTCSTEVIKSLSSENFSGSNSEGFHTFAACGEVTLIDSRRIDHSLKRGWINWQRRWRNWTGQAQH